MNNSILIFEKNSSFNLKKHKNICIKNGVIQITIRNKDLNNQVITSIVRYINYIQNRFSGTSIPIRFILDNVVLTDKLSYILFECIIESLMTVYHRKVEVFFNLQKKIITEGISSSPLLLLGGNKNKSIIEKNKEFKEKFKFDHYKKHFRRVVRYEDYQSTDGLCKIYDEVAYFQKSFNINYDCVEDISEVIVELIGNAIEHSKSDCLIDFDIATNYRYVSGEPVCGINIAIISFSNTLLGDGISEKIKNLKSSKSINDRYAKVISANNNHYKYFDENYDSIDFNNISTFQHRISGSEKKMDGGGMGLTKLIKSIEDKATDHTCYVLSGDRIILFEPEYLEYDEDGWIGFNESNDYFYSKPSNQVLQRSNFYMPGTAYNLNFVMKVNNDEQ